jgi:kynurenine formamidase
VTAREVPDLPDEELLALMESCSNAGRWGDDDELGTLNLLVDDVRRTAAALVTDGHVVPLGRAWPMTGSTVAAHPVVHRMLHTDDGASAIDSLSVTPHDPQITHVDALGHIFFRGRGYNGRREEDVVLPRGLSSLSVAAMRDGIFTRGVLLDICAARSVDYLAADDYVTVEDLEAAEQLSGVRVREGDALVLHVGRAERIADQELTDFPVPRAGVHASVLPWLHERGVSVFLGDCTERLPPEPTAVPLPLHMVGIVAMGLCLVDGALTSELAATCARLGRHEFLFTCTIPDIPGATGFPVAPLCLF